MKVLKVVLYLLIPIGLMIGLLVPLAQRDIWQYDELIRIHSPNKNIAEVVMRPESWKNWFFTGVDESDIVVKHTPGEHGMKMTLEGSEAGNIEIMLVEKEPGALISTEIGFENGQKLFHGTISIASKTENESEIHWISNQDAGYFEKLGAMYLGSSKDYAKYFGKSLQNLKEYCESVGYVNATESWEESKTLLSLSKTNQDNTPEEVRAELTAKLRDYIETNEVEMRGEIRNFISTSIMGGEILEVAVPVAEATNAKEGFVVKSSFEGKTLTIIHEGGYAALAQTHDGIRIWLQQKKIEIAGTPWEIYRVGPAETPDSTKWRTDVVYPVY